MVQVKKNDYRRISYRRLKAALDNYQESLELYANLKGLLEKEYEKNRSVANNTHST